MVCFGLDLRAVAELLFGYVREWPIADLSSQSVHEPDKHFPIFSAGVIPAGLRASNAMMLKVFVYLKPWRKCDGSFAGVSARMDHEGEKGPSRVTGIRG